MSVVQHLATLVIRQDSSTASSSPAPDSPGNCIQNNDYNGRLGVRVSAVFVILVTSLFGAMFPVFARSRTRHKFAEYAFFVVKYFGSGVIVATAFIHLLAPAVAELSDPCLTGVLTLYPWALGIALIMVFILFFIEIMTVRYAGFGHSHGLDTAVEEQRYDAKLEEDSIVSKPKIPNDPALEQTTTDGAIPANTHIRGHDHFGHGRDHVENSPVGSDVDYKRATSESYASQLTAIFILEFGVIFHSVFIGLTLAVAGDEFVTLYIVIIFHQTFEGLGLGTRIASVPWPESKKWTPYLLALGYGLATPISIAIGLGVRQSIGLNTRTALITNGVFDSISAGILIYTGLVELMAHEFLFSPSMRKAPIKVVLAAFTFMVLGAGIMALLGRWA